MNTALSSIYENCTELPWSGCWIWNNATTNGGYGVFTHEGRKHYVHRVVAKLAINSEIDGAVVCHKCDTPSCVNPEHLFVGTQKDNMSDASRKGRIRHQNHARGSAVASSKLNDETVKMLRATPNVSTYDRQKVAEMLGVNERTVRDILANRTWRHV